MQKEAEAQAEKTEKIKTPPPHGRGDTSKSGFLAPSPQPPLQQQSESPLPRLLGRASPRMGGLNRSTSEEASAAAVPPSPGAASDQEEVKEAGGGGVGGGTAYSEELPRPEGTTRTRPGKTDTASNGTTSSAGSGVGGSTPLLLITPKAGQGEEGDTLGANLGQVGSGETAGETGEKHEGRTSFAGPGAEEEEGRAGAGRVDLGGGMQRRPSVRQWPARSPADIGGGGAGIGGLTEEEESLRRERSRVAMSVASSVGAFSPSSSASSVRLSPAHGAALRPAVPVPVPELAPMPSVRRWLVDNNKGGGGGDVEGLKGALRASWPLMVSFGSSDDVSSDDGGSSSSSSFLSCDDKEVSFPS